MSDGIFVLECFGGPRDGEWLHGMSFPFGALGYHMAMHPTEPHLCWFYSPSSPKSPRP